MIRPDGDNAVLPKGRQRLFLLLPILFLVGQFLNLLFANVAVGSFQTNDVVDAWILVVCIYAASIARCCSPADSLDAETGVEKESRLWSLARFLNLSSVATLGLAVVTGAMFPPGIPECTIVIGCACQVIAFVAIAAIWFGGGRIVRNKLASVAIALGLSFVGSGTILMRKSTANLGIVLPVVVLLAWAAHDIKFAAENGRGK